MYCTWESIDTDHRPQTTDHKPQTTDNGPQTTHFKSFLLPDLLEVKIDVKSFLLIDLLEVKIDVVLAKIAVTY